MAKKKHNGNGNGSGNGKGHDPQLAALERIEKALVDGLASVRQEVASVRNELRDGLAQVQGELAHVNARVDRLSDLVRQTNERLDHVVENTGTHYRGLEQRVSNIEDKLKRSGI